MGTPALTTRGLREDGMKQVATWIISVLSAPDDGALASRTRQAIREFARDYPVPADAPAGRVALT
jgi:glycine hydroxymethyltransferase